MLDDWILSLLYATFLVASTMPIGLMLGSECSKCCGCKSGDGKPITDPAREGTWVPSGTWRGTGSVTWTFTANPGNRSGETWFFHGEFNEDWGDICNWFSSRTSSPSSGGGLAAFDKRATRLPPVNAVVHIFSPVSTATTGPVTVKHAYFWNASGLRSSSTLTATSGAYDSDKGSVFVGAATSGAFVSSGGTINGGAFFIDLSTNGAGESSNSGVINGGATFTGESFNNGTVNGGAVFSDFSDNGTIGTVNGGATFNNASKNSFGSVNGGATFNDTSLNEGTVAGGATFNDTSEHSGTVSSGAVFYSSSYSTQYSVVDDGAEFFNASYNAGTVNDGATFNDTSKNWRVLSFFPIVNGGATFNDESQNILGIVNGGATFNDSACSTRTTGFFSSSPCSRKFVAHPTDLPTCNGSAPSGCANAADTCGCG
jgi:hypothetical protein